MKSLTQLLTLLAFAMLGFYFFWVIKGAINAPTSFQGGGAVPVSAATAQKAPPSELAQAGKSTFRQHCTACHKVNQALVGPALAGVNEKYASDPAWLYSWIRNAPKLIDQGDERALALYEQYGQMMTAFPFLTDEDIDGILAWIEYEAEAS